MIKRFINATNNIKSYIATGKEGEAMRLPGRRRDTGRYYKTLSFLISIIFLKVKQRVSRVLRRVSSGSQHRGRVSLLPRS